MPSSDRIEPGRDRHQGTGALGTGTPNAGEGAKTPLGPVEPPQYFDPSAPWDAQSAEALTRLYESGEADLHQRHEHDRARAWPRHATPAAGPAGDPPNLDTAWLEARLADITQRLQDSLSEINPDKSLAPLNNRLDQIEERFNEALGRVAQRSDLDGLQLIEAHVLELAAHVEQTRGRLDRIDAIDDQVRGLAHRLGDGDQQRLDALEKLLQDYMTEWRRRDERTASSLHTLEDAVTRIGDTVEAMEAHKPAPDLSMSMLGAPGGDPLVDSDPLSQVYADAERVLGPKIYRSPLDAADYVPAAPPAEKDRTPPAPPAPVLEPPPQDRQEPQPAAEALEPPAFRALAMRAKLRQAQVLNAEAALGDDRPERTPMAAADRAAPPAQQRARPSILLAAGITLFAAGGYLLVDVFMTPATPPRVPADIEHGLRPTDTKATRVAPRLQPDGGADIKAPVAEPRPTEHTDGAAPPTPPGTLQKAPAIDGITVDIAPAVTKAARMDAIGSAIAAVFRAKAETTPPPVETASLQKNLPAANDDAASVPAAALPMTIGPASLRQAALRGDAAAQVEIAARFATGQGVARDLQQAFQWYGRAAARGLALAQYRLAVLHERGLGTVADPERARTWYGRAAEQGNVKAMHNLAVLNVNGGRSDYAAAAKWFAQAAEFGLADSQFNLAVLHQNGLGVPKDLSQAYKWLELAARGGDREATGRVAEVKARLSATQLQAADAAIASWRPRTPDPNANEATALTLDAGQ